MTRTMHAAVLTDLAASSAETCALVELQFSGGSVRLAEAGVDISWNGQVWQGAGRLLGIGTIPESGNDPQQRLNLTLSGVDQTLLAIIQTQQYRGRKALVYDVRFDRTTGQIIGTPLLIFDGRMNGGFTVQEQRGEMGGGSLTITGRITSRLTELARVRGIRTNVASHQASGIPGAETDRFFEHVAGLMNRPIYWGSKAPWKPGDPFPRRGASMYYA